MKASDTLLDLLQIGKKLSELRQIKELTQDELAETLFVSHQAISKWERGLTLPSIDNLCYMMEFYSVSLEELLCLESKKISSNVDALFLEHNREYIVHEVATDRMPTFKLQDIIHKLSCEERMYALYLMIDRKLVISEKLWPRLSLDERQVIIHKYIEGNTHLNVKALKHLMTLNEVKKLKEKNHEIDKHAAVLR